MARVHNSFEVDLAPDRAQAMFVRDLVPDLRRDGRFSLYREQPGELRLSDADFGAEGPGGGRWASFDFQALEEMTDPDEYEINDEEAGEPVLADVLRRGADAEAPAADGHHHLGLELLASHRLRVRFVAEGSGTRVTIRGSAHEDVRNGLERLGSGGHWPETAAAPHD